MKENNKSKYIIAIAVAIGLILFNKFINDKSDNLVVEKSNTIEEISNKNPKAEMIDDIKKVHISGEILNQGVYEIKDGDRLEDLVQKAGGLTEEADLDKINLSMKLEDQMRIIIPNINQPENNLVDQNKTEYITNNDATININTASKEELMTLPNIGEKRAESIINYRESNRFENIEDIMKVDGIGEKYFDQMRDMIRTNWGFIMKLSTRGRYGLRAVHYLAENQNNGYVSVSEIAENLSLPENYLEQLIRLLKKNGFVKSARGAKGGYKLSKQADQITVGDVLRVLEGEITASDCVASDVCQKTENCEAYFVFAKIDDAINNALNSITIEDMVENNI